MPRKPSARTDSLITLKCFSLQNNIYLVTQVIKKTLNNASLDSQNMCIYKTKACHKASKTLRKPLNPDDEVLR
jgi:hypothetical protein